MQPALHINYLAILAAVVVNMVVGFLWYGPVFGKAWVRLSGLPADFKPTSAAMIRATLLQLIGAFLMAYCLAHSAEVWRPSVWNAGADHPSYIYGIMAGFFTWLGFILPVLFGSVAWEGKSWKLLALNAGYYFIVLQLAGQILAHWR